MKTEQPEKVIVRDVTLREGMDAPGVEFSFSQRMDIAVALSACGIPEIEIVAPAKVAEDSGFAVMCGAQPEQVRCRTSGLVYAAGGK